MRRRLIGSALERRNESSSANGGFKAGLIVGVLNAIYTLVTTIMYKDETIAGLEKSLSQYTEVVDVQTIYSVTLVVLPIIIVLLLSIIGIFVGILLDKFKRVNKGVFMLGGAMAGVIFGVSLSSPSPDLDVVNIFVGLTSGLLYTFLFMWYKRAVK